MNTPKNIRNLLCGDVDSRECKFISHPINNATNLLDSQITQIFCPEIDDVFISFDCDVGIIIDSWLYEFENSVITKFVI